MAERDKQRNQLEKSTGMIMSGHLDPFSGKGTGMTTSFILFLKEKRDQIVRENPHFQQKEIASLGGKLWRELPQV
jgi:hypothetical protein